MENWVGSFTYMLKGFTGSELERPLVFHIMFDDGPNSTSGFTESVETFDMFGPGSPDSLPQEVCVSLFDGAATSGFLQISEAFNDLGTFLSVVQEVAWLFSVGFLKAHRVRFVEPVRAYEEIRLAVREITEKELVKHPSPPNPT